MPLAGRASPEDAKAMGGAGRNVSGSQLCLLLNPTGKLQNSVHLTCQPEIWDVPGGRSVTSTR